jgi:hypothetical protein
VPPPAAPQLFLKSAKVNAGGKLKLTVITEPGAGVTITIQVTQRKVALYRTASRGQANGAGQLTVKIKITFHPAKATKARVTVEVQTAGGTAANTIQFTILPHS